MGDLHARLLAEIERREGVAREAIGVQQTFGHYDDADGWIEMLRFGHNESAGNDATLRFGERSTPGVVLAYLAALKSIVETIGEWRHAVVDDCWYTCAAATEEREGSESCAVDEPGDCDCGLDIRRSQVLAIVAEGLGVEA